MSCSKINKSMEDYIDGSLSEKKQAWFDNHFRNCPHCQKNLLERQGFGKILSGSMKKMTRNLELSPKVEKAILSTTKKSRPRLIRPLILWPRFAVYAILPLLVLGFFLVFIKSGNGNTQLSNSVGKEAFSYLKLTTAHYKETSSNKWLVKRTHIQKSNGQEGFLTLETIRDLKEQQEE